MPRGVKAKDTVDSVTIEGAENGWFVSVWFKGKEGRHDITRVFTDLGELLGFLEEELEQ